MYIVDTRPKINAMANRAGGKVSIILDSVERFLWIVIEIVQSTI